MEPPKAVMAIPCVCPNGHPLSVEDHLAGKMGVCPTCGVAMAVPTGGGGPGAAPPVALPRTIQQADSDANPDEVEWRLAMPGGEQHGPTVPVIFAQWIVAGRVPPDAMVWRTGWTEWRTAEQAVEDLPAPLPVGFAAGDTRAPKAPPTPTAVAEAPRPAKPKPSHPPSRGAGYTLRKRRQSQQRRRLAIALAVVCVALAVMLGWLIVAGPPALTPTGAP